MEGGFGQGFCDLPEVISAHPTVEVDGQEVDVLACRHDDADIFLYKGKDGCIMVVRLDYDGVMTMNEPLAKARLPPRQTDAY